MMILSSGCDIESSALARSETMSGSSFCGVNSEARCLTESISASSAADFDAHLLLAFDAELPGDDAIAQIPLQRDQRCREKELAPERRSLETGGHEDPALECVHYSWHRLTGR